MKSQASRITMCLCWSLWSKSTESSFSSTVSEGSARWFLCLELDFHMGCHELAPVLTAGPKCEQGGSKPNLGLLQPQPGLGFGILVDLPAGSRKSEWCGAAMAWFWFPVESPAMVFPGGSAQHKAFRMKHGGNPWGKQQLTTQILLFS